MDLKQLLKFLKLNESKISMIFGAALVLVVVFLAINYFRANRRAQPAIAPTGQQTTTPAPAGQEGKVPANLPKTHKVEAGQHLWKIAETYYKSGYNWVDIAQANNLANPNVIEVGQELTLPETAARQPTVDAVVQTTFGPPISGDTYTAQKGDHLWGISVRAYADGFQWVTVAQTNKLKNPNIIHVGQVLKLPRASAGK